MADVLDGNLFLVKEHVGALKAANEYDVFDPETGDKLLECREPGLGLFSKLLRFTDKKRLTPFDIVVQTPDGRPLVRVKRGWTLWRSKVQAMDGQDQPLGSFRQKMLSVGGAFQVLDHAGQPLCRLKGNWRGWNFKFTTEDGRELASVNKKWSGVGKELFTSADNYMLTISEDVPPGNPLRRLIMGSVMCIDMVLKE
jgi:uncharacterized protein YxjI